MRSYHEIIKKREKTRVFDENMYIFNLMQQMRVCVCVCVCVCVAIKSINMNFLFADITRSILLNSAN